MLRSGASGRSMWAKRRLSTEACFLALRSLESVSFLVERRLAELLPTSVVAVDDDVPGSGKHGVAGVCGGFVEFMLAITTTFVRSNCNAISRPAADVTRRQVYWKSRRGTGSRGLRCRCCRV